MLPFARTDTSQKVDNIRNFANKLASGEEASSRAGRDSGFSKHERDSRQDRRGVHGRWRGVTGGEQLLENAPAERLAGGHQAPLEQQPGRKA